MPLSVPNLDDRTYDDLLEEALEMLPRYAPRWTNHNPSDPGITLVELLAYFTEILIYRLNRLTRETKLRFLQLLWGIERLDKNGWERLSGADIDAGLRQAVRDLSRRERAVTADDYEYLARDATAGNPADKRILRAQPFARRNLDVTSAESREEERPGHVSMVILPVGQLAAEDLAALLFQVRLYLEPRRLLATRLHVVPPFFLWVTLSAKLHMRSDADENLRTHAAENALKKLQAFFSPWPGGGPHREGWPFGRSLYLSELYEALEQVEGVDYVTDVNLIGISTEADIDQGDRIGIKVGSSVVGLDSRLGAATQYGSGRILRDGAGRLIGIALRPYELIGIAARAADFSTGETAGVEGAEVVT
jgi:hypothetical protein